MTTSGEVGKAVQRWTTRANGEPVPDNLLPGPSHVSAPIPSWNMRNEGMTGSAPALIVRRVPRGREDPILLIEQNGVKIEVHPGSVDELYDVLRAAKAWKAP